MLEYKVKELNLTHTWTLSRSSTNVKHNVFVKYSHHGVDGIGEAAPNLRYKETAESTVALLDFTSEYVKKSFLVKKSA